MSYSATAVDLRQKRAKVVADARAINDKALAEKRSLTAEERQQIDRIFDDEVKMKAEIDALEGDEKRFAKLNALSADMNDPISHAQLVAGQVIQNQLPPGAGSNPGTDGASTLSLRGKEARRKQRKFLEEQRSLAFRAWCVNGQVPQRSDADPSAARMIQQGVDAARFLGYPMHSEQMFYAHPKAERRKKIHDDMAEARLEELVKLGGEQRAGTGPTQSAALQQYGAYIVPEEMMRSVEVALKMYWDLDGVTHMKTAGVGPLIMPQNNDTTNKGAIVSDGQQSSPVPITFSALTLQAYLYTSNVVLVPISLLTDTAVPIDGLVGRLLGIRIGRILADHMTFGYGGSQPFGIKVAATLGYTAANSTSIVADDLYNLKHSVDPAYRSAPTVKWMFHDKILLQIKLLKSGIGTYLWQNGLASGAPDTIDGQGYIINQSMPSSVASGGRPVLYGDLAKYCTREVETQYKFVRLVERYMDQGCVGFIMFSMWDGGLNDAGTHPVTALQQP